MEPIENKTDDIISSYRNNMNINGMIAAPYALESKKPLNLTSFNFFINTFSFLYVHYLFFHWHFRITQNTNSRMVRSRCEILEGEFGYSVGSKYLLWTHAGRTVFTYFYLKSLRCWYGQKIFKNKK